METTGKKVKPLAFLTDGGLETDFIFNRNISLPHFASFPLLENPIHRDELKKYYIEYLEIAKKGNIGFILESPTWRANKDWGFKLGYDTADLDRINKVAIAQLHNLRSAYENAISVIKISGCIGPRGDAYKIDTAMTSNESEEYHYAQIQTFAEAKVDFVSALTIAYIDEAMGIVKAAKRLNTAVVISFTVETHGLLPSGESLGEAINRIDRETNSYPLYYMINCAHPTHFIDVLETPWSIRIEGIRANASCKSHAELDASEELDAGHPGELAYWHERLMQLLPELKVLGGCCGTDVSHVNEMYKKFYS